MARPHIQVILAADAIPHSLGAALQRTPATAGFWPLSEAVRAGHPPAADAIVVVVPEDAAQLAGPLRVLFDRLAEHPRATLVLTASGKAAGPLNHPATLPVTFDDGRDERDLSVRLATMLEMRNSLDSLHQGLLANRRSGESIAQRYKNQLRLARQVQREFLPEVLPRFGPASFNVVFRPVDYVSGDIHEAHRLDEEHVGIALADATGHGIPAALLTVYIKRALRGKEIDSGSYRILSPDEVLARLNDDILDAQLTECPFVAAVYAVLNTRTLELALARGGAPYPIYRTAGGDLHLLRSAGSVVGVLPNCRFEVSRVQLQPGDSLLIYSDGLERIVAPQLAAGQVPATLPHAVRRIVGRRGTATAERDSRDPDGLTEPESGPATAVATLPPGDRQANGRTDGRVRVPFIAPHRSGAGRAARQTAWAARAAPPGVSADSAHDLITNSTWYALLGREGPEAALEHLAARQRTLRRMGYPLDDLTVLCLQIDS